MKIHICCECGKEFNKKWHNGRCASCTNVYQNAWRKKRIALGFKIKGGSKMTKEYHKKYYEMYWKRPEVKIKAAIKFRKRRLNPLERPKILVRELTHRRIKSGILIKKPCEVCGEIKVQAHHKDYSKPLEVMWLCIAHHKQIHSKSKGGG